MARKHHITLPKGFRAAGVRCGLKTNGLEDLSILAAERDVSAAVLTTRNQIVGAPVTWCRTIMPRGYGRARGIVVNSGNSNVCTGPGGLRDARQMAGLAASRLGTTPEKILVASTGIIGHRLPMAKVRRGIDAAAAALGTDCDQAVLRGIMTTDSREKSAVVTGRIGSSRFTVAGIAKGAGMIAPSLATMISLVTTDLAITPAALHAALAAVAKTTYNAVTIDSDTSTSDTVAMFASGAAGNGPIKRGSPGSGKFISALGEVCGLLARQIASDGEGATKLVEVTVRGARTAAEAEIAARSVANSPLFKCAINGQDPNWGRIAMALGKSAAKVEPEKLTIRIGGVVIFSRGRPRNFDVRRVGKHLAGREIQVLCDLALAAGSYTALTCDLSRQYVAINADYHT